MKFKGDCLYDAFLVVQMVLCILCISTLVWSSNTSDIHSTDSTADTTTPTTLVTECITYIPIVTTTTSTTTSTTTTTTTISTTTSITTTTSTTTMVTTTTTTTTAVVTTTPVIVQTTKAPMVIPDTTTSLTTDELYLLATLVTLEGGVESYECKKAIASTVINRMVINNSALHNVIYAPNQYSVTNQLSYTTPTQEAINAVNDVIENGVTIPRYVTYFRARYYHTWGDQVPYTNIGNTYFSYSAAIKSQYE